MEYWYDKELVLQILERIEFTIQTILRRNESILSVNDYLNSESGLEKLDAACMLIQTIGENIKVLDNKTQCKLLVNYPQIPWKRVIGMRDYISHHYDGVDADVVFEVVKHNLPPLLEVVRLIISDMKHSNQ